MPTDLIQLQPSWLDAQCPREGRYVLGPLVGKGGMGEVVEAWDMVLCRTVALKILRNMEPTAMIRFMHEAQIQARVAHPHICRIYDVDSSEGTIKIAMQLVRGPNLEQACRDLSLETVVTIMAEVAEAVHAAHRLKLIHRDLKPSNILLERSPSGRWTPNICDFGLAMALDEPALTYTNGILGTPAYMAPEQLQGDRARIGPATDVYGLGGTLYFALLGKAPPSAAQGLASPSLAPALGEPTPQFSRTEPIPADLWLIIRKCLEQDPDLRYPSASALAEDLWRFLNGEPIQASRSGTLDRIWRRTRPYLKVTVASALVLAGLLGSWVVEGLHFKAAYENRQEVQRQFATEASDLENEIRMEGMLPIHDLRPANNLIAARLAGLRARMEAMGGPALGPGHLALARTYLLLGACAQAQIEARQAWDSGFRAPEAAYVLACAIGRAALEPGAAATPASPETAQRVEGLFSQVRTLEDTADDYPRALVAFLRKDYAAAAAASHAHFRVHPWASESASLEVLSLCAIAYQSREAGDLPGAENQCREALSTARSILATEPSNTFAHHAYFLAARWLASIQMDRGDLPGAFLPALEQESGQALLLDPGNPGLQDDWLGLRFLDIRDRNERGLDPGKDLDAALVFLGTRTKRPLAPGLDNTRRLLYWQLAERALAQGRDPGPALNEAQQGPDHAPFLQRDYLGQMLNFKARAEAARGVDPRPTVKTILARFHPGSHPSWILDETSAEAWLIKGEWEASHGLDATESLGQTQALSDDAIQANPGSPSAYALSGLARVLEMKVAPARLPVLRMVAQERLRAALALKAEGGLQTRLKRSLQGLGSPPK